MCYLSRKGPLLFTRHERMPETDKQRPPGGPAPAGEEEELQDKAS